MLRRTIGNLSLQSVLLRTITTALFCHRSLPLTMAASTATLPVPEGFTQVREGAAAVLFREQQVFYNPAMVTNRDLSVVMLRLFIDQQEQEQQTSKKKLAPIDRRRPDDPPGIRVLEALAASGTYQPSTAVAIVMPIAVAMLMVVSFHDRITIDPIHEGGRAWYRSDRCQ
jgi:hypothetical protein